MVQEAIRFIEEKNYIVHYGDSVTYDTPCLVKNIETEEIEYKPICDLYDNDDWIPNIIDNKEYNTCSKYLVWSNNGWTAIKSVMRHKVEKKIFRINTHIGCVDVTEDHSLYTDKNIKISPKDCTLETKLLHKKYDLEWEFDNKINKEYAFILGYFASDGTCGIYNTKWGVKNNWYLDAWCHTKEDIRSFAIDAIQRVEILETKAIDISESKLKEELGSGYGIFSGKEVKWATLRFTPERARWIASERWHSKQVGKYSEDGSYELRVPYSKEPELIIDIMKYGPDVEVVEPKELRKAVQENLIKTLRNYGK